MEKKPFKECTDNEQKDISDVLAEIMFGDLLQPEKAEKLPPEKEKKTETEEPPQD